MLAYGSSKRTLRFSYKIAGGGPGEYVRRTEVTIPGLDLGLPLESEDDAAFEENRPTLTGESERAHGTPDNLASSRASDEPSAPKRSKKNPDSDDREGIRGVPRTQISKEHLEGMPAGRPQFRLSMDFGSESEDSENGSSGCRYPPIGTRPEPSFSLKGSGVEMEDTIMRGREPDLSGHGTQEVGRNRSGDDVQDIGNAQGHGRIHYPNRGQTHGISSRSLSSVNYNSTGWQSRGSDSDRRRGRTEAEALPPKGGEDLPQQRYEGLLSEEVSLVTPDHPGKHGEDASLGTQVTNRPCDSKHDERTPRRLHEDSHMDNE